MTAKNINKLSVKVLDINPDKLKVSLNNISIYAVINKMYVKKELIKIKNATSLGNKLGLEVHAGHGLTFKSAKILAKVSGIKEFNIGHFIIGESLESGMPSIIKEFKKIVR